MTPNGDEATVEWNDNFSGIAYLSVYGENDCGPGDPSDELEITVDECTGIDDPQLSAIKIYPNPAGNTVTVNGSQEMESIILTDINGKYIETVVPSADGETQIDLSGLKTGIYLIKIMLTGEEKTFRLLKK